MQRRPITEISKKRVDAFWSLIRQTPSGCWEWQGGKIAPDGYGFFSAKKNILAHRYSYRIYYGTDPGEMCVMHICDNRPCVSPLHLRLGTYADNNRDRAEKGRTGFAKGEGSHLAKLNETDVILLRKKYANGSTIPELTRETGIHRAVVRQIVKGETWKHVLVN